MKFFAPFLALTLCAAPDLSAADLGALQSSFITRYDEVNATRDDQLKNLQGSYAGALERHLDKIKASGEIEKAIPVRDEIEAVKAATAPLPEIPESADPELKSMRAKYVDARTKVTTSHAESLVSLADKMNQALEGEEKDLTRNGKFEDALAAKRMRETLGEDQGIANARKVLGSTAEAAAPIALGEPADWKLLIKQRMKVEEKGQNEVGSLSDVAQGGKRFWNRMLTGESEDPDEILVTPSPCLVTFTPREPAREIRGSVKTAFPGARATVRIKSGDKVIFEEEVGGRGRAIEIDETFDVTEALEIEVEQEGDASAWVYWSKLEVR